MGGKERLMGRGPKPTKGKAQPAVPRKSRANEDSMVRDLEKRLAEAVKGEAEAREQQAATAEILHVISRSPADAQPVFDAIARNAATLCSGITALVLRFDGEMLRLAGHHAMSAEGVKRNERAFPRRPTRDFPTGRAFLDGSVIHVPDLQAATEFVASTARQAGAGSLLCVPLLHEHEAIGVIGVTRDIVGPFSSEQIEVLQTFADQAVIAIENVRLFKELEIRNRDLTEALEQQTATSEVLSVIGRSNFDLQPVLDTLIENAARLCEAPRGVILRRDSDSYHGVAFYNASPEAVDYIRSHPVTPGRHTITARVALERRTIHVADLQTDAEYGYTLRDIDQVHTELGVPMFRGDEILGVIILYKFVVQPFTGKQIALIETFAAQAVIAIENVRLFNETKEALEQQTATSEILRVISQSPTDVQPVFNTIMSSIVRLCDAKFCVAYRYDGGQLHMVAHGNLRPRTLALLNERYPQPPSRETATGISTLEQRIVHIPDATVDDVPPGSREFARQQGWGSLLAVPLLRDGQPVGSIAVARVERQPFSEQQIALVQTFADQAVIAIENMRLFKELETRNRELTTALEQQSATSEILKVISQSPTDVQPVFDTIARSAVTLCDALGGNVQRLDGELRHLVANHNWAPADFAQRRLPIRPTRSRAAGRAVLSRTVVHIPDVREDPEYSPDVA